MKKAEFQRLLDSYGADFDRWPEAARTAARAFLEATPEMRAAIEQAASFDRLLDDAVPDPDPLRLARLADRIRRQAAHRQQGVSRWENRLQWLYYSGAFAVGAACAAMIGSGQESTTLDLLFSSRFSAIFGG